MSGDTTRRALLLGSAATAIGASDDVLAFLRPAGASSRHMDAALLALRDPYEQSLAVMNVMSAPHDAAESRFFAIRGTNPNRDEWSIREEAGLVNAERNYLHALRANSVVIERITATQARTVDGLKLKAEVSKHESNTNLDLIASIVDDILAMEGTADDLQRPRT